MKKKRKQQGSPLLQPGFTRGTVPWSLEELEQYFARMQNLADTPKDDWPLKKNPGQITLADTGDVIRFNQFHPMYHEVNDLLDRYPSPTGTFHYGRIMRIQKFLQEEWPRLLEEGWILQGDGGLMVDRRLLRVLATGTYSKHVTEPDGMKWFVFDYGDVTAAALALPEE